MTKKKSASKKSAVPVVVDDEAVENEAMEEEESHQAASDEGDSEAGEDKPHRKNTPRKIYFVMGGNIYRGNKMDLVTEKIEVRREKEETFDRIRAEKEVLETFQEKYSADPEFTFGPFYDVRDPNAIPRKKRETISVSTAKAFPPNGTFGKGIYKNWVVKVGYTENRDLVWTFPDHPVDTSLKGEDRPPNPGVHAVHTSAVQITE